MDIADVVNEDSDSEGLHQVLFLYAECIVFAPELFLHLSVRNCVLITSFSLKELD